jgi:hypothetical protein
MLIKEIEQIERQDNDVVASPLDDTVCALCNLPGNRRLSGRLLYCDGDRWVHVNCALWSDDVKENVDGYISGVLVILKNKSRDCDVCQRSGATISCINSNCKKKFHFNCSYTNRNIFL